MSGYDSFDDMPATPPQAALPACGGYDSFDDDMPAMAPEAPTSAS